MTTSTSSARQGGVAAPAASPPAAAPHRGVLPVVLVGPLLSSVDFFIVNVAIPSVRADLHTSAALLQLIIAGYALTYGCGMIVGGRLGDLFGRRRIFALGMSLFTLASVACGVSPSGGFLLGARAVQGAAAALMAPQVLAIFSTIYSGEERAKAINWYGFVLGLGAAFGQLIGGVLIKINLFGLDWRTCFLINLPIGIVGLIFTMRLVPESRAPGRPRLDLLGMVWVTAALLAVVLPLTEGRQEGWPIWTWVLLGLAVPMFAGFALYQNRSRIKGHLPLIDPRLFKERAFTAGLLAQLVFWCGQASFFLVFALYLQTGRGMSALNAGLLFGALGIGYMLSSMTARLVAKRMGRQVIALGGALRVIALIAEILIVTRIGVGGHIQWLIPAIFVDGAGMGFAVAPLASTVLSRVTPSHAGSAAGVLTTALQVGNALGVAMIGLIFYRVLGSGTGVAYAHAYTNSLYYLIGIGAVVILLVQLLPKRTASA
jgi:EmrB/QacA subfamily drug resistance transporter